MPRYTRYIIDHSRYYLGIPQKQMLYSFDQGSLESGEETDSTCTTTASRRLKIVLLYKRGLRIDFCFYVVINANLKVSNSGGENQNQN